MRRRSGKPANLLLTPVFWLVGVELYKFLLEGYELLKLLLVVVKVELEVFVIIMPFLDQVHFVILVFRILVVVFDQFQSP